MQLTGGNGAYEGRVEINIMTYGWGNVCDNSWDMNDATVSIILSSILPHVYQLGIIIEYFVIARL